MKLFSGIFCALLATSALGSSFHDLSRRDVDRASIDNELPGENDDVKMTTSSDDGSTSSFETLYDAAHSHVDSNETSLVYFNASDFNDDGVVPTNVTRHKGFLHGFVESLSVILVSEIGDKTFFIAAIMAMTNNKLTVFLGAIMALALMTVLSGLLGWVVTSFIPRKYTYYTCTVIMFLFGLKMLYEAWKMKPEEQEEIQQEVEAELNRRGSINSMQPPPPRDGQDAEGGNSEEQENLNNTEDAQESSEAQANGKKSKLPKVKFNEKSLFGKKCYKIFKVFLNCFTMTFLAEWGDRSQLATIVLASVNDVAGVCIGGVLGHTICTGAAVICGALVAKKISVRVMTLIGALVFIGFAIASLFYNPETEEMISIDL